MNSLTIDQTITGPANASTGRLRGWLPLIALPLLALLLIAADWPRWALMWLLALAIYAGCKWLTWRRTPVAGAPWWKHAGYLLAWPGLDAAAFLTGQLPAKERPRVGEWARATLRLLAGAALFWGAAKVVPRDDELLLGWLGMIGVVLMLHFGAFQLLSCVWRAAGVPARPLMERPWAATRVSAFWQRWNTAFHDLTHRFLFRTLAARLGPRWGLAAGFLFSGIVHDLVISVPAGGGYGGPTLFFAIQALAILLERSRLGRSIGLGGGWVGWLFTALVLVVPAPLLFHPPFVRGVAVPFMRLGEW
jgi:alginate O-acetyltransferase complex protein AlgI